MGLYHPHEELHHIKKENIGLIEVMGLAVLPSRLKEELDRVKQGGADWLHSAPAPQPEPFNIMDPFHKTLIPLDSWVTHAIDWIVLHFRPLFQGIRVPIDYILSAFQQLLLGMPAPVAIIVFALIAWQISSLGMGVATLVSLIAIGAIGAWSQAMVCLLYTSDAADD